MSDFPWEDELQGFEESGLMEFEEFLDAFYD